MSHVVDVWNLYSLTLSKIEKRNEKRRFRIFTFYVLRSTLSIKNFQQMNDNDDDDELNHSIH